MGVRLFKHWTQRAGAEYFFEKKKKKVFPRPPEINHASPKILTTPFGSWFVETLDPNVGRFGGANKLTPITITFQHHHILSQQAYKSFGVNLKDVMPTKKKKKKKASVSASAPIYTRGFEEAFHAQQQNKVEEKIFKPMLLSTPYCPQVQWAFSHIHGWIYSCQIPGESDSSRPLDSLPDFSTDCPPDCPPDCLPDCLPDCPPDWVPDSSSPVGLHLHSAGVSGAAFCLQQSAWVPSSAPALGCSSGLSTGVFPARWKEPA